MASARIKNHTVLSLIIRSGSVHARISSVSEKRGHETIRTHIENVFLSNVQDSKGYIKKIQDAVKNVLQTIAEEARKEDGCTEVDYIAVYYSSPWFTSDFLTFPIGNGETHEIFSKETMSEVLRQSGEILHSEYQDNKKLKPIEQHISTINLNGYDVTKPYGKSFLTGEISLLATWISQEFQENIIKTIMQVCQHGRILHFSFPYALISSLEHKSEARFCILDVHSEITDMIFMKNSIVEKIESVPVGTNHLLKKMNHGTFSDEQAKKDFLNQLYKKYLDPAMVEEQKNVCEAEILRWYESLMNVPFFKVTDDYIILADQPFQFLFQQCLEKEKGIPSLYQGEDVEKEHVFSQTDLFWLKYIHHYPEHLERLQK